MSQLAHFVALLDGCGLVGINEVVEQAIDAAGIRSHAAFQHVVGISFITQQLGYLATQINQPLANLDVVLRVVVCADGVACHIQLLAQLPLCRVSHEGRERGIVQCERHPTVPRR